MMKKIFLVVFTIMLSTISQVYAQLPTLRLEVTRCVTERWDGDGPYSSTYYLRATNTGRSTIAGGVMVSYSVRVSDTQGTQYGGINGSDTVRVDVGPGQSFEFSPVINPGRPFVTGDYIFTVESLTLLGQTATNVLSYRYRVDVQPVPSRANLVAEGLEIRPVSPQSGNTVSIIGTVANRGTRNANGVMVRMQLIRDNRTISNWQDLRVDSMAVGSTHSITQITGNLEAGIYMVMFTVDPNNAISEIKKSDNGRAINFRVGSGVSPDSVPNLQLAVTSSATERSRENDPLVSTFRIRATNTGRSTIAGGIVVSYSVGVSDTQGTLYGGVRGSENVPNDLGPGQSFEFFVSINPGRPYVAGNYIFTVESLTLLDQVNRTQSRTVTNVLSYRYIIGGGSIVTAIEPGGARDAFALWWVDGDQTNLKGSGQTVSNLSPGIHRVEFRELRGWKKPDALQVNIRSTETVRLTGTYVQRGSLSVSIEPARARDAGAQWRMSGGDWQNSGTIVQDLDPGPYNIEFKETAGWVRPSAMQVEVRPGQTTQVTGPYTQMGSLSVTINPQAARELGAQWGVSLGGGNESAWQESGTTVANIRPGSQRLRFKSLNDARWITPETVNINIASGQTTQTSATYRQNPGALSVLISPVELRDGGGQWRVSTLDGGGAWQNSGVYQDVPPSQHTIEFKRVNGWVTPVSQNINVNSLQRIQMNGEYRPERGSIQVTIQPEGWLRDNAKWRIVGQNWRNSGETVYVSPGTQAIEFWDMGVHWEKPPNQSVTITGTQAASVTGTYRGISGMLNVTIAPNEAVQSGAQWRAGNRPWKRSGETDASVPLGPQQVELNTIPGWVADPVPSVNISAGQLTRTTGSFRRGTGSIMITLQPAGAIQAGAQWRVDGGPWQNSGSTLPNVTAGSRNIEYKEIPGWTRPGTENVVVNTGQTTSLVKNYTQQPGSLQVTIIGSGGDFTGRWQVDNMGWKGSNVVVNNITPGSKRIEFNEVPGWIKPNPMDVTVTSGQLQRATATYTRSSGLLRVIIQPGNVEAAGGQWRIDGGTWQPSRQLLSNIAVGAHQVEYSDVAGWVKPPPSPVNIIGGQSTQITGTYQRR
jgi:hypothetical protein